MASTPVTSSAKSATARIFLNIPSLQNPQHTTTGPSGPAATAGARLRLERTGRKVFETVLPKIERLIGGLMTAALLAGLAVPATAQKAYTIPVSDRLIEGTMTLPGGEKIGFVARDGGLVTIQTEPHGTIFGFAPQLRGPDLQQLEIFHFEIQDLVGGGQSIGSVGDATFASFGSKTFLETAPVEVEFHRVLETRYVSDESPADSTCCVTCGSNSACGCRVTHMSCGTCCAGTCCGGGGPGGGPRDPR